MAGNNAFVSQHHKFRHWPKPTKVLLYVPEHNNVPRDICRRKHDRNICVRSPPTNTHLTSLTSRSSRLATGRLHYMYVAQSLAAWLVITSTRIAGTVWTVNKALRMSADMAGAKMRSRDSHHRTTDFTIPLGTVRTTLQAVYNRFYLTQIIHRL